MIKIKFNYSLATPLFLLGRLVLVLFSGLQLLTALLFLQCLFTLNVNSFYTYHLINLILVEVVEDLRREYE